MTTHLPQGQFSEDWFAHNIPRWTAWLAPLRGRPGLRALEIGSFEGRSTLWLCEHILTAPDARIDCLDLFTIDPVYGDYAARFRANTAAHAHKIRTFAGPSFDGLRRVDGPYDIIYIDGWHSAFGALADGVMSWPMLAVGGVMIFDDYLWTPPRLGPIRRPGPLGRAWARLRGVHWHDDALRKRVKVAPLESPKLGVDGLLATLEGHYALLGAGYQLAVRKTRGFDQGQLGHDT